MRRSPVPDQSIPVRSGDLASVRAPSRSRMGAPMVVSTADWPLSQPRDQILSVCLVCLVCPGVSGSAVDAATMQRRGLRDGQMVVRGWLLLQLAGAGLQVPQRPAPVIGLIGPPIACQQPSTMQACSNGRRWVAPRDAGQKYLTSPINT